MDKGCGQGIIFKIVQTLLHTSSKSEKPLLGDDPRGVQSIELGTLSK